MSHVFPKMLYLDGAQKTVANAGEEVLAVCEGWGPTPDWTTEMAEARAKAPPPTVATTPSVVIRRRGRTPSDSA